MFLLQSSHIPPPPPPPMNHFPHTKLLLTCTHNLNTFTACKGLNVNQVWEWYYMKYILHLHFYHPSAPLTPHFPSVHVVLLSLLELSTIALKLLNFPSSLPRMPLPLLPPPPPPPAFFFQAHKPRHLSFSKLSQIRWHHVQSQLQCRHLHTLPFLSHSGQFQPLEQEEERFRLDLISRCNWSLE